MSEAFEPAASNDPPFVPEDPAGVGAPPSHAAARPLDRRVIQVWRLRRALSTLFQGGVIGFAGLVVAINNSEARPWVVAALGAWLALRLYWIFWHTRLAYAHWSYRLDDRVLELAYGVWWKTVQLLPLSRLQHADVQRGPIERRYGVASLALYTAGTHGAVLVIPGLPADEAIALRNHLVAAGGDDGV